MQTPGAGGGLTAVLRNRFLLRLLVRKEIRVRYRGSVLGLLWSYLKPLLQFSVYYVALGIFLNLQGTTENYAVYLFSGIVLINFFTEAFGNATRSIVENRDLIKKIYLPRELFPMSAVWVSAVHFFPQVLVLGGACLIVGWRPDVLQLFLVLVGFLIVACLATGLGLLFGAVNVYFRDAENLVDMILMVVTWASPVLYSWNLVSDALGPWFFLYQLNPMTVAVELFHYGFWVPTLDAASAGPALMPDILAVWVPTAAVVSVLILLLGQFVFRRLSANFAQEL
ncbi:ABC transporter permease [Arthrobacter sp. TmT3-37]|uniref:Transport permease protein n=1 Tax=Arthrobacter agilis TaxID=37921 RepID=A0A2L0UE85_9MICC|nr:ABC transporter permease [Arthrobacter agilis]AUZ87526.1 sugar ABC transporter permease [Arthrobacter agilis]